MTPKKRDQANAVLAWINFGLMTILLIGYFLLLIIIIFIPGQWSAKLWAVLMISTASLPIVALFYFNWIALINPNHHEAGIDKIEQSL